MTVCTECGTRVHDAHYPHDPGCPNRLAPVGEDCWCDNPPVCHTCCPTCQEQAS
jgi:hypothetical protein